jgi:hypothetical protein
VPLRILLIPQSSSCPDIDHESILVSSDDTRPNQLYLDIKVEEDIRVEEEKEDEEDEVADEERRSSNFKMHREEFGSWNSKQRETPTQTETHTLLDYCRNKRWMNMLCWMIQGLSFKAPPTTALLQSLAPGPPGGGGRPGWGAGLGGGV